MDQFLLLRFAHLIGLMLMSAGLIGVFVADMRSRQVRDVKLFAQAVTFIAVFYDGLVVPGALLLLASGLDKAINSLRCQKLGQSAKPPDTAGLLQN